MSLRFMLTNPLRLKLAQLAKKLQSPSLRCQRTKTLPLSKQLICAR